MQEEVNQRTVALTIKATKLTGKVLAKAFQKWLAHHRKTKAARRTPHGRQTVKQLGQHYGDTKSMQLVGSPRQFDHVAKEFKVNYAFYKTEPGHYLLFFKARQADEITAAFAKYTKRVLNRNNEKTSIHGQLRKFAAISNERQPKRQRSREAVKEER